MILQNKSEVTTTSITIVCAKRKFVQSQPIISDGNAVILLPNWICWKRQNNALSTNQQVMPDDYSKLVPHLPIPNRTVKRLCADDSAATSVKVGHRQALIPHRPWFKPNQGLLLLYFPLLNIRLKPLSLSHALRIQLVVRSGKYLKPLSASISIQILTLLVNTIFSS